MVMSKRYIDMYYPDGFKSEEQPMRNTIKVIDKDVPKNTIMTLERGQMFRYPKGNNDQNIYMIVDNNNVVLLATGSYYTSFNRESAVEVVDAISITR